MGIHASVDSHSVLCYEGQRRERLAQHKERIAINTSQEDVSSYFIYLMNFSLLLLPTTGLTDTWPILLIPTAELKYHLTDPSQHSPLGQLHSFPRADSKESPIFLHSPGHLVETHTVLLMENSSQEFLERPQVAVPRMKKVFLLAPAESSCPASPAEIQ